MSWDDGFDYYVPENWSDEQGDLYDSLLGGNGAIASDHNLQFLYQEALFDLELSAPDRAIVRTALEEYLRDNYGISLKNDFDWSGYREWYDNV